MSHDHDRGFAHDLPRMTRRGALALLGAAATFPAGALAQGTCVALPQETNGPFPADGSNGLRGGGTLNVLTQQGVIREDLRASFAGMTGVAEGVRLRLDLTLVAAQGCAPLAGHAIYVWHCDAVGRYSLYDLAEANYLRGMGVADAAGRVRFETIVPGCYPGRWPHIHFEVFRSAEAATDARQSLSISQLALPADASAAVYSGEGYGDSAGNLGRLSLGADMVFRDNADAEVAQQTLVLSGDAAAGFAGTCTLPLAL